MKKILGLCLLIVILALSVLTCKASTVRFAYTNWNNTVATNAGVRILPGSLPMGDDNFAVTGPAQILRLTNGVASITMRKGTYEAIALGDSRGFVFEVPDDNNTYWAVNLRVKGLISFISNNNVFTNALAAGTNVTFTTNGPYVTINARRTYVAASTNIVATTNGDLITLRATTDTNVILALVSLGSATNINNIASNGITIVTNLTSFTFGLHTNSILNIVQGAGGITNHQSTTVSFDNNFVVSGTALFGSTIAAGNGLVVATNISSQFGKFYGDGSGLTNLPGGSGNLVAAGAGIKATTNTPLNLVTFSIDPPTLTYALTNHDSRAGGAVLAENLDAQSLSVGSSTIEQDGSGSLGNGGLNWDSSGKIAAMSATRAYVSSGAVGSLASVAGIDSQTGEIIPIASPWYYTNVLQAGVVGGTTNDTPIIQSLLNRGIPVYFPPSTNYMVLPLFLTNNSRILGQQSLIRLHTSVASADLFNTGLNTNFAIENMRLDGQNYYGNNVITNRTGIRPYAYSGLISGNTIMGFDYGIFPVGDKTTTTSHKSPSVYIIGNLIQSNSIGAKFYSPGASTVVEYITVRDNKFIGNGIHGVVVDAGNINILGGEITDNYIGLCYPATGVNTSHGLVSGVKINHNVLAWVACTNITSGQSFLCNDILSSGNGYFDNCRGINIQNNLLGGQLLWFVNGSPAFPNYVFENGVQVDLGPSGGTSFTILNYDGSCIHYGNNPLSDRTTSDHGVLWKTNSYTIGAAYNLEGTNSYGFWMSNSAALYLDNNSNGVKITSLIWPQSGGGGVTPTFDPTQFGGPAGGTNIISGASLTNSTIRSASLGGNALTVKGITGQASDLISFQDKDAGNRGGVHSDGGATFGSDVQIRMAVDRVALTASNATSATANIVELYQNAATKKVTVDSSGNYGGQAVTATNGITGLSTLKVSGVTTLTNNLQVEGAQTNSSWLAVAANQTNYGRLFVGSFGSVGLTNSTATVLSTVRGDGNLATLKVIELDLASGTPTATRDILIDSAGIHPNGNANINATINASTAGWSVNTNMTATGAIGATNGFTSQARVLAAPIAITVGSSPFLFTNSVAANGSGTNNIYVFIDGSGVTGTVGINGTTVYSALAGADCTIPLQPNEYVTVTYTIGTPVMKWKPF